MHYVIVGIIIILALGALFGVGVGVGTVQASFGLLSWGILVWCAITLVSLGSLALSRGLRQWVGANSALAVSLVANATTFAAIAHWYETQSRAALWVALIGALISIIALLKHSCRRNNWCQHVGPNLRNGWNRVAGFGRGPGANFAAWSLGWIKRGLQFVWNNLRVILTLLAGGGLIYTMFYGELWVSAWWWALAFVLLVLPYKKLWAKVVVVHWKKLTFGQQALLISGAVGGLGWCLYLAVKWGKNESVFNFHIPMWGISGVSMVAAVTVVGLVVLSIMMRKSPKKPTSMPGAARRAGANP